MMDRKPGQFQSWAGLFWCAVMGGCVAAITIGLLGRSWFVVLVGLVLGLLCVVGGGKENGRS